MDWLRKVIFIMMVSKKMVDYKKDLFSYAYKQRIPLTVTIELLSNCNFRCIHCYIDKNLQIEYLTYDQIVSFGTQIIEMGCLYVVLTGGEVLLHPSFKEVYMFFVKKGVSVSVFSNGSLISEDIINLFVNYPPRVVEITMYGFGEDTYYKVTNAKCFKSVRDNVLALKEKRINVLLKMFVLRDNYADFPLVKEFAEKNSIPFKFDTRIIAEKNSNCLSHQLDNNTSLELGVVKSPKKVSFNEETKEYISKMGFKLFICGAGRCSCWLKSNYKLRMCNFLHNIEFSLNEHSFEEVWEIMSDAINADIPLKSKCRKCGYREFCLYCPALSLMEFGRSDMMYQNELYCQNAQITALRLNDNNGMCL